MGGGTWSGDAYKTIKTDNATKTQQQIFSNPSIDKLMNPFGIKFREARDSADNPKSLGIMCWLDETGSMGKIPEELIREKLGAMIETMIMHGVVNPAVFFGGIGDHYCDRHPLQIGQFESATVELAQWLTKIYLEGNGGGNGGESYLLAHLFAARHTSIDCFEKRNQKGFLFTIGDEPPHEKVEAEAIKKILGYQEAMDLTAKQVLQEAQRTYNVFHLHINHGNYQSVDQQWRDLLGERLIVVDDYRNVAEIMATTVAVVQGADLKTVTASFDKQIGTAVNTALAKLHSDVATTGGGVHSL